ncbi:MAG: hypothetical protein MUE97_02830 [Phycisphaerales bacterium]|jgi:hypothetical protein|nr:hypothetical protein [Phycisphaerales bacterium]
MDPVSGVMAFKQAQVMQSAAMKVAKIALDTQKSAGLAVNTQLAQRMVQSSSGQMAKATDAMLKAFAAPPGELDIYG